ncbi:MAG: energy transducer TonB [Polyangiales bacterium]
MRRDDVLIPLYLWASFSVILHLGFVGGTTAVVARLPSAPPPRFAAASAGTSEVEFVLEPPPPVPPAPRAATPAVPVATQRTPEPRRPPDRRPEVVRPPTPRPLVVTPPPPPELARPPQPRTNQHFIDQDHHAQEPTPTDPHYLAPSNRNVDEETIAAVRSLERDRANPREGANPTSTPGPTPGNGSREVHADSRDEPGRRDRVPNESRQDRPPERPTPAAAATAQRPTTGGDGRRAGDARPAGTPAQATASSAPPSPTGEGPAPAPSSTAGEAGQGGEAGRGGRRAAEILGVQGLGPAGTLRALMPRYDNYVAVYGREEIQRQRDEAAQRRSEARGSTSDDWAVTRAALENFVTNVRVGNQTALRAAASPFAGYIVAMHNRIHRTFADGFIPGLAALPESSPLNDRTLHTTLEIIIERDGRLHRINIVRSSGTLPFDVAAMNSVRRAAPFGEAPAAILSGDGRVYVHWGFYRNERQCGPFNAEPFILPNPAGAPSRPSPSDALPTVNPGNVGLRPAGQPGGRAERSMRNPRFS